MVPLLKTELWETREIKYSLLETAVYGKGFMDSGVQDKAKVEES